MSEVMNCRVCGEPILYSRRQTGKDTCGPRHEFPAWDSEVASANFRVEEIGKRIEEISVRLHVIEGWQEAVTEFFEAWGAAIQAKHG